MGLRIRTATDELLLSAAVKDSLHEGLASQGLVSLLVPNFSLGLGAQKGLAQEDGLSLGVTTTTPRAWADERWGAWGDGSSLVGGKERVTLMRFALELTPSSLARTAGTLDALLKVAREALARIPYGPDGSMAEDDERLAGLTAGELEACRVLATYRRLLHERGLRELCEVAAALPEALPASEPLVVAGFSTMAQPLREMLVALAAKTTVTFVVTTTGGPADGLTEALCAKMRAFADARGIACEVEEPQAGSTYGQDEIAQVRARLFRSAHDYDPVVASGMVSRAVALGPRAEWELVARRVQHLRPSEAEPFVATITVADTGAAWRELAPKLAARGMRVRASLSVPATDDPHILSFLSFAQMVAHLAELSESWPQDEDGPEGPVPQLGDMTWWPPRALTDFLLSEIGCTSEQAAWALDAKWRGNRNLSPAEVLTQLQRESLTSRAVAQATAAVLRGRLGMAANQLARAFDEEGEGHEQAISSLMLIRDCARSVGGVLGGIPGDFQITDEEGEPLSRLEMLCSLVSEVVGHCNVVSHGACGPEDARHEVRIVGRAEASTFEPHSADALVLCNLTAAEWPLSPSDTAADALLVHLGADQTNDPLDVARRELHNLLAVPRHSLVLERCSHDADAHETYPAVMLTELLTTYGLADESAIGAESPLAAHVLGEEGLSGLVSASGARTKAAEELTCAPTGVIGDDRKRMIVVPREGESELPGGMPSLSASQIETYLECPYKWFTLRRLGLGDMDATFSNLQMGTFAHRVLEVSRRRLAEEAAQQAGLIGAEEHLSLDGGEPFFIPGARITQDNIAYAKEQVKTEFSFHIMHQRQYATTLGAQSLVPHNATEEWRLARHERELLSVIDYELGVLEGFAPRYFELRFGGSKKGARHVTYAGADFVGSIDRVDVDAHGRAVVIDYKHKASDGFSAEYDVFAQGAPMSAQDFVLPRRVQSLIYAQVVRKLFPELKVVGAVYLSTMGISAGEHEIAGALDANVADQVLGHRLSDKRAAHLVCGGMFGLSFEELLDACEERIAERIESLVAGKIEADPVDESACSWCPVANCERKYQ